ncbi:MAG: zinc ribbon domain-containing protein [Ignavibacteriales bacterium]|nr:zinc ribbon domain-containing protein [Ignavibacteriales bacterium]
MKCPKCGKDYPSEYYFSTPDTCNECFDKMQPQEQSELKRRFDRYNTASAGLGRKRMNSLLISAIIILILSVIAAIWGYTYTENNKWEAFMGYRYNKELYQVAGYATIVGIVGFFIGIGLLIGGLVQQKNVSSMDNAPPKESPTRRSKFCSNCGLPLESDAEFCSNCGTKVT